MGQDDVAKRLAIRLKKTRKDRGLSLEALAKLSGVSRSMLSQIERGESSPTVSSLWNLTQALRVDFSGLLDGSSKEASKIIELIKADRVPIIQSQGEGCDIKILSAPEDVGQTEVYDISFTPVGELTSQPHRKGCIEQLTVLDGKILITVDKIKQSLEIGDTIRYHADVIHSIKANDVKSRCILVVKGS